MIHLDEKFTYFMRSVHLDAQPNHARNVYLTLSGIHDFVQQVARYDSLIKEKINQSI